jgi:hypothetical protein
MTVFFIVSYYFFYLFISVFVCKWIFAGGGSWAKKALQTLESVEICG